MDRLKAISNYISLGLFQSRDLLFDLVVENALHFGLHLLETRFGLFSLVLELLKRVPLNQKELGCFCLHD